MSEEEYLNAQDEYGEESFRAGIGAEALKELLEAINLEEGPRQGARRSARHNSSEAKRKKLVKRLKLLEAFIESGTRPEWMILSTSCR